MGCTVLVMSFSSIMVDASGGRRILSIVACPLNNLHVGNGTKSFVLSVNWSVKTTHSAACYWMIDF